MNWKLREIKISCGLVECIILEFPGSHKTKTPRSQNMRQTLNCGASRIPKKGATMTSGRSVAEEEGIRRATCDTNNMLQFESETGLLKLEGKLLISCHPTSPPFLIPNPFLRLSPSFVTMKCVTLTHSKKLNLYPSDDTAANSVAMETT